MIDIMTRVFHPIGQGAFYSERHDGLNVVYDCGEWKDSNRSELLVKNSFQEGDCIHLLFISHFDFDHISKVDTLRTAFNVKTCILPLLQQDQLAILKAYYSSQKNESARRLVEDPVSYFGENTKVIFVEFGEGSNGENEGSVDLDSLGSGSRIQSGKSIKVSDWLYVPYNLNHYQARAKLESAFQKAKLDFELFMTDMSYALLNRVEIKKLYNKLPGGINLNSMVVYSGPCRTGSFIVDHYQNHRNCSPYCHHFSRNWEDQTRAGCIYTGDTSLKIVDLAHIFRSHISNVGTIQLPHHGDKESFESSLLSNEKFIFPVSYGSNNTYGHPANQVIVEILQNGSLPIHVNEMSETIYVQIVKKWA